MKRPVKKPAIKVVIPVCSENPVGDIRAQSPKNKHPAMKIWIEYLCRKKEKRIKISASLNTAIISISLALNTLTNISFRINQQ
jgi:hypothetical protein